jgi:ubiquinone/menaquinone biosynthesis C-methylase UbiE
VTATDISEYAIASLLKWEHVFQVKVDRYYACCAYETNEPDGSIDHIFCFAAAHHFVAHRRTLQEISRILKPGRLSILLLRAGDPKVPLFDRAPVSQSQQTRSARGRADYA